MWQSTSILLICFLQKKYISLQSIQFITMRKLLYLISFLGILLTSCSGERAKVVHSFSEAVAIDSSLDAVQDEDYLHYLQPIHDSLERQLSIPLGYAPEAMQAYQPESPLLNWASDALYEMALQTVSMPIDFAVVNVHGLRCDWPKGNITFRNVFELMPFDNRLVILQLSGKDVLDLCQCFADVGGEGASAALRMQIVNGKAQNIRLNGKRIDVDAVYNVATSDYLSTGADHMEPLANFSQKQDTQVRIRDLYIQYIEQLTAEGKQVTASVDGRMQIM